VKSQERRESLLNLLIQSKGPITGSEFAKEFKVSRQVIVQDIALLRARGIHILATSNGYVILNDDKILKIIKCKHNGTHELEDELNTIIELGGKILDIIVNHPVYGEIKTPLLIGSKFELDEFIKSVEEKKAQPLFTLTDGIHFHTIEIPNITIYNKIVDSLKNKHYLISK
jgi:transcriptional regulator of NAD metabolism